jgi:hypothetical protein
MLKNKLIVLGTFFSLFVVSLQAAPQYESNSSAQQSSRETYITIPLPPGTVENDLLVAAVSTDGRETITAPSGWSEVNQTDTSGVTLAVFYHLATANEPADYTFTWNDKEEAAGAILRYSGVDTRGPVDVSAIDTGKSKTPTAPDATTTVKDTRIVRVFGAQDNDLPVGAPSGHELRAALASSDGASGITPVTLGAADTVQASTGAVGTAAFSLDTTLNENWVAVTLAVKGRDTDGDGVPDSVDIDDDNDGILDIDDSGVVSIDGGFEQPQVAGRFRKFSDSKVPGWNSAVSGKIEIWKEGFLGFSPYEGRQLAELNVNNGGEEYYQDIATNGGDILKWSIAHRARGGGTEEANVSIGAAGGTLSVVETMADTKEKWVVHSGTYQVPAGQSQTRIAFTVVTPTGGAGNLLDGFVVKILGKGDSDGDGVNDTVDLDSDNDGIPDNVEAQPTGSYIAPTGNDTDGDGLDDAYDPDNGGTPVSLPDSDGDGVPDFQDSDSDNDGYSDCEEGISASAATGTKSCPISSLDPSDTNGLVAWAEINGVDQGYSYPNGIVTVPDPDNGGSQLDDEVHNNNEAAYREFLCGKNLIHLTAYNWRLIGIPCDTGSNEVQDLLSGLGTYGSNYVLYKQTGDDGYETNATHKNTNKTRLDANSTLEQGIAYWIITDADRNVTIDRNLTGLAPTGTTDANDSAIDIDDSDFEKVHKHQLPNNEMTHGGDVKKYMAGNPFPYGFLLKDLYFSHGGSGGSYKAMGSSANDSYIDPTFYKHDSPDTSDQNTSAGGGYEALDPKTPGFDVGGIKAMEGFFIKLPEVSGDTAANYFAYPLMMKNGHGEE